MEKEAEKLKKKKVSEISCQVRVRVLDGKSKMVEEDLEGD